MAAVLFSLADGARQAGGAFDAAACHPEVRDGGETSLRSPRPASASTCRRLAGQSQLRSA